MLYILLFVTSFVYADYDFKDVGPILKARRFSQAKAYRYHTHYNKKIKEVPIAGLPWVEEDCHDDSNRFFNWGHSQSFSVSYTGGVSFSVLGLGLDAGVEIGKEIEISFERWVQATRGIRARHELKKRFEEWEGVTFLETIWEDGTSSMSDTPSDFLLTYINPGLTVKRTILEHCSDY